MASNAHISSSTRPPSPRTMRKYLNKAFRAIMKSHRVQLPRYNLPIRLRPWFLVFTSIVMIVLAFLGLTDFSRSLPLNDKLLRFMCLGIATGVFYFIFDVEEDARRVWLWRHSGLIFTAITCFFFGGLVSEIVQSLLPHKIFDFGGVVANMMGSSVGLYISYHLEKHYRTRREISRLYRPLDTEDLSEENSDDDTPIGTQLLPLFHSQAPTNTSKPKAYHVNRLGDVWDEREELFGIGGEDSSSEDDHDTPRPSSMSRQDPPLPTIVVTGL